MFRSRWATAPWWLTLGGRLGIVPADYIMSRDMLHGVKQRAEKLHRDHLHRSAATEVAAATAAGSMISQRAPSGTTLVNVDAT